MGPCACLSPVDASYLTILQVEMPTGESVHSLAVGRGIS